MKRKLQVWLIVFCAVIGIYYVVNKNYWRILQFVMNGPNRKQTELSFGESETKLYLNSYSEGLNYHIRSVSAIRENHKANENTDYIFTSDLDIFYEVKGDTLKIYTLIQSQIPAKFSSKVIVKQIKLTNPEYMNLYDKQEELRLKIF
jgi:hypothetical protein